MRAVGGLLLIIGFCCALIGPMIGDITDNRYRGEDWESTGPALIAAGGVLVITARYAM
ncbi:hypothetical protein [Streptomyces sp. 7N604]|uniref:hypothetical protein n=1 Tax=Streptomyces sp. 7N604 TaxID=3457415 RepID=UPI003FCF123E